MSPTAKHRNDVGWRAERKAAAKQARKEKREAAKRAKWNQERKEQRRRRRRRERLGVVPVNSSYITVPSGPAPPPLSTASTSTAPREPHPLPARPHLAHPLRLPASTDVPLPSFERPLQAVYPTGLSVREWIDPAGKFVRRKVTADGAVLVQREGRVPADSLLAAAMNRGEYGGVPGSGMPQRIVATGDPDQVPTPQVLSGYYLPIANPTGTNAFEPTNRPSFESPSNFYPAPPPTSAVSVGMSAGLDSNYNPWNSSNWDTDQNDYEDYESEDDGDEYQGPYDDQYYDDMDRYLSFCELEHGPFWE